MKKILVFCIVSFFSAFNLSVNADTTAILNGLSDKISGTVANMIPGEGVTEVGIELKQSQEPSFNILAVRDLQKTDSSNFFTQFGLHTDDVNGGDNRYIGNLGVGYRTLTADDTLMLGINLFYDRDLTVHHQRIGWGIEARGAVLEFNTNFYEDLTQAQTVSGTDEAAMSGHDSRLATQIPHMPWTKFSWTGYRHHKVKASEDTKGDIFALELALMPSLQFDLSRDIGTHSDGNAFGANINFIYPPQDNKPTLLDGFMSDEMFTKAPMTDHLSDKVERENNLIVEVQGSVIITSK